MATLKERLEMNSITGTTDEYSGADAATLLLLIQVARGVVEAHWAGDSAESQRQRIRALESALKEAGA